MKRNYYKKRTKLKKEVKLLAQDKHNLQQSEKKLNEEIKKIK